MDGKAKRKWYKSWRFWFLSFIFLMLGWGGQPYYGWNYCVGQGFMRDTDFIEELRPVIMRNAPPPYRAEVSLAVDAMKACVSERGLQYCRYVGPDQNTGVNTQQDPNQIPEDKRYNYIFIDKELNVGLYILPWGDMSGGQISTQHYNDGNYKEKIKFMSLSFCMPGCGCDSNYSD